MTEQIIRMTKEEILRFAQNDRTNYQNDRTNYQNNKTNYQKD
jgi:hypothetical protein